MQTLRQVWWFFYKTASAKGQRGGGLSSVLPVTPWSQCRLHIKGTFSNEIALILFISQDIYGEVWEGPEYRPSLFSLQGIRLHYPPGTLMCSPTRNLH